MSTEHRDDAAREEAPPTEEKPKTKVIKRYSNRKLYDTDRSKYVTLDEIARMIKAGEDLTIIDNESKEDLTSVTLTQIIYEEEKRESRMPLSMLRNLIQSGGTNLSHFFDRSVKTPVVEMSDKVEKSVEKSVEELVQSAAHIREAATRSVSEFTESARRMFSREERRAEEFKKATAVLFDHLEERLDHRREECKASLEAAAGAEAKIAERRAQAENGEAAAEADEAAAVSPVSETAKRLAIAEHAEVLRARLQTLEDKLVALEELDRDPPGPPPEEPEA